MRRTLAGVVWSLAIVGLVLLQLVAGAQDTAQPPANASPAGALADAKGIVADLKGNPVAGAEVYLYSAHGRNGVLDRFVGKTTTDSAGAFAFPQSIQWEAEPFTEPYEQQHFEFIAKHPELGIDFEIRRKGDPTDDIRITLSEAKKYTMTLTDEEGKPVPGVRVYLYGGEHRKAVADKYARGYGSLNLNQDIGVSSGTTDDKGQVELMGVPPGRFWFEKEGYVRIWNRGATTLLKAAQVSGTVTYPDGKPAKGALVTYIYHGDRLFWDEATLTDAAGHYAFANAPAFGAYLPWQNDAEKKTAKEEGGSSEIKATSLDPQAAYEAKGATFDIKPGESAVKDIRFEEAVVLQGTVVDATTGQPVANMILQRLIDTGKGNYDAKELKTDASGAFRTTVPPGTKVRLDWQESRQGGDYLVDQKWRQQGHWMAWEGVAEKKQEPLKLSVKLMASNTLTGRVMDKEGKPVADAMVYVHSDLPGVKTGADGTFTMKVVPRDKPFDLLASADKNELAGLVHLPANATEATITLEPTKSYEGRVVTKAGLPATKLKFYLDARINDVNIYEMREEPTTDADGKFTARHLCPQATYYAWWSADNDENRDYDYGNATIDLTKLKEGDPIQFEAPRFLNSLIGCVKNEKGEAIAGAKVSIAPRRMQRQSNRNVAIVTDAKGEFIAGALSDGEVTVMIRAEGYKPFSAKSPADNAKFEAILKPRSTASVIYEITVKDESGAPMAGVPVALHTLGDVGAAEKDVSTVNTDAKGACSIPFAPPTAESQPVRRGYILCDVTGYDLVGRSASSEEDGTAAFVLRKSGECWKAKVVDGKGQPIAGAKVVVIVWAVGLDEDVPVLFGEESPHVFTTDVEGRFTLARFNKKDRVTIKIMAAGCAAKEAYLFDFGDDKSPDCFTLEPGGTIAAKVVLKGSRKLLSGMGVHVQRLEGSGHAMAKRAEDEGLLCEGLAPGKYSVFCAPVDPNMKKYLLAQPAEVEVIAGQAAHVELEVEEGVLVKGVITGAKPKETVFVSANPASKNARGTFASADKDGAWQFYLLPGSYELKCATQGMREPVKAQQIIVERGKPLEGIQIQFAPPGDVKAPNCM